MKILIIQEKGRHALNQEYREALNLHRALTKIGTESVVWGLNYDNFSIPFETISEDCDAIVLLENYETGGWLPDLSGVSQLKLFWSIDSHCIPQQHVNTCDKHNIDIVLNAVFGHERLFKQECIYFSNAYPDDLIHPMDIEKTVDIGFCGNYLNRKEWIDAIDRPVKQDIFVIGDDMVKAINSYKIHFNRNIIDDINFRTFETLGCNTLLLTNHTPGLEDLFTPGENIVTYTDGSDLNEKVEYYLSHDKEREEMALKGYEWVKANHTYVNRAKQLVKIIDENGK